MNDFTKAYRSDDYWKFKRDSQKYFICNTVKKTMGGFCEHLHITRKTLSKYRQRDNRWKNLIADLKMMMDIFNLLGIRGEVDLSEDGIREIIECLFKVLDIYRYDVIEDDITETIDQEDENPTQEDPIDYDLMDKYEDDDGTVYYEDDDGNIYYPNE